MHTGQFIFEFITFSDAFTICTTICANLVLGYRRENHFETSRMRFSGRTKFRFSNANCSLDFTFIKIARGYQMSYGLALPLIMLSFAIRKLMYFMTDTFICTFIQSMSLWLCLCLYIALHCIVLQCVFFSAQYVFSLERFICFLFQSTPRDVHTAFASS